MKQFSFMLACCVLFISACAQSEKKPTSNTNKNNNSKSMNTEKITLGSGCFWCTEAVYEQVKGVIKVTSGYCNGHVENPTYEQVCDKTTGHTEACEIEFDPKQVTVDELLEIFWQVHDPTTLNRQGNDVGPQYRSAVFYHNEHQKERAEYYKKKLDESGAYAAKIVTAIEPIKNFYSAENYHQDYYKDNSNQPYCYFVIRPKLEKFEKVFKDKLKSK
jgi:peptide-methionine (S)-S-oxide reductase